VADMLADGAAWLAGQLKTSAGRSVTYVRGSQSATVTATVGNSAFESQMESGVIERFESRHFVIVADDLPFGEPRRGDRIRDTQAGTVVEYELVTPRGVPLWQYADAFRASVKIHTTQADRVLTLLVTESGSVITTETFFELEAA